MDNLIVFIESTLREIGAQVSDLEDDCHLEDHLGLDSLMRVDLAVKLQKKYGKPVVDHIDSLQTIGELVNYLKSA